MPSYKDYGTLLELGLNSDIVKSLDPLLKSIQIDNNNVSELSFKADKTNPGIRMLFALAEAIACALPFTIDAPVEKISFHPPDGMSYPNATIVIGYETEIPREALEYFGIPETIAPKHSFTLKFDLVQQNASIKIYDSNTSNYRLPNTPEGTFWGRQFGIGRSYGKGGKDNQILDFYFAQENRETMKDFLGDKYPHIDEDFDVSTRGYSICVDSETGRIVCAKRYIHLADPGLFNPLII